MITAKEVSPILDWVKTKTSSNERVLLDEGWEMLDKNGIQLIFEVLKSDNINKPPFSTTTCTELYSLSYYLSGDTCTASADYSLELYHRCKDSIEWFLINEMIPMLQSYESSSSIEYVQVHRLVIIPC